MRAWREILFWLVAIAGAGVWAFVALDSRYIRPLRPSLEPAIAGDFPRGGVFPTTPPLAEAPTARVWGSWAGTDTNRGILTLGPFAAPARLQLGVAGYPAHEGNGLFLELIATSERWRVPATDTAEKWQLQEFDLPAAWVHRPVRLVAVDAAIDHTGWLGVSEPLRGGWSPGGEARRAPVLNVWSSQALLLALVALGGARAIVRRFTRLEHLGNAIALLLLATGLVPWLVFQNQQEPNFTTMLAGVVGITVIAVLVGATILATPLPLPARLRQIGDQLRDWWENPGLNPWVLGALALLLFLRKPHALHTPQLWAEDGSIFLTFNDLEGLRAWIEPYMGYLHTLPRVIAWTASRLLDPAWWPAFYNGVAFTLWLAVIGRTFSRRFILPAKPWLALAFLFAPQTGEVLFNVTNVQWITAFVFVQQVLLIRPANAIERITDLIVLALAGLTGPFAIAFASLLLWRWWRERHADHFAAPLVVAIAAGIQAWFILKTGEKFPYQAQPFQLWPAFENVTRRVLIWPALGRTAALSLPDPVIGAAGILVIGGLLIWTARPHLHRELRLRVAAAFFLILAVVVYRFRPDTWEGDDLYTGDRYFYIPRVLLAWLLILQFDARPKAIAWSARLLCLAMVVAHLKDYTLLAPPDYHWREHCDPIRRGVPGDIPSLPEGWILEYRGRPGNR